MFFRYGSFQHPNNEVNLASFTQRRIASDRGQERLVRKTMQLQGVFIASTQAAIKTGILAREAAYATWGRDAALFHDDGTISAHSLVNSESVGGVRVLAVDFPEGNGAEYATQRSFSITLEADFITTAAPISFQETLRFTGTGGRRTVIIETLRGSPQKQVVNNRTIQRVVQSGSSVGELAYPTVPPPIFPGGELQERREIVPSSPRRQGDDFIEWPVSWIYHFAFTSPVSGVPHRR